MCLHQILLDSSLSLNMARACQAVRFWHVGLLRSFSLVIPEPASSLLTALRYPQTLSISVRLNHLKFLHISSHSIVHPEVFQLCPRRELRCTTYIFHIAAMASRQGLAWRSTSERGNYPAPSSSPERVGTTTPQLGT